MKRQTKVRAGIGMGGVGAMLFAGIFANTADAYSLYPNYPTVDYSVVYNNESGGSLSQDLAMTRTGDQFKVEQNGQYPTLSHGLMYAAVEQATVPDGQGSWPIIQADMTTNTTGAGYLLIATPSESSDFATWVKRLGGNLSYIENYMQSHNETIELQDDATNQTYNYYPFSLMVNESGAIFGNPTAVPNGKIYRDANNGQSYPEYTSTQHISTSKPPVATSLSAVDATTGSANITQGDPVTFTAQSTVYLFSQIAGNETKGHHYDAIELRNDTTGKTYWVAGSGSSDITNMKSEIGGHGYFTNTFTYNNLPTGSYTASFWVGDEVDRIGSTPATTTFTVAPAGAPVISLTANPTSTTVGQSSTLTATVGSVPSGDIIKIIDKSGANTLSGANSYTNNQLGATQLQTQATSQTAQTVNYEAELVNQTTGTVDATATASVQWGASAVLPPPPVAPSIELSANPQSLGSGQPSTVSYAVSNLPSGDSVSLTGTTTSGVSVFSTSSYTSSGSYIQSQSPVNGNSTTVNYSADILNDAGQLVARSNNVSVTWTSTPPSIALQASPTKMVPGQPSRITYTVSGGLPAGDTVSVTGSGNAAHPWSATGQTSLVESDTETEDPSGGQTIAETYTATIRSSSGQPIASAQTSVQWTNAWTGTIQLTASPNVLAVGKSTTLQATTSESIPSGYILVIVDEQTGQTVASGTASTLVGQYASGSAKTYDFVAYVTDGYVQTGPLSNTVQVQWVGASLSATPSALEINHLSTITATAENMPSGDWLILFDETTGQVLGTSQGSTVSASQTESTAQTDSYVAYVSTTSSVSNEFVTSTSVHVDWYSITLTGNPTSLPVSQNSTLTATAQNVPSGYELMIVDQTTGKIIAQGTPGQTTLVATQNKSTPEKDTYVAEVAVPPSSSIDAVASTNDGVWQWNGSQWTQLGTMSSETRSTVQINGILYAATWGQGVWEWNGSQWSQLSNTGDTYSVVNYNGALIVSDLNGVYKWDGTSMVQFGGAIPYGNGAAPQLYVSPAGNLYVAQWDSGVYEWDPSSESWIPLGPEGNSSTPEYTPNDITTVNGIPTIAAFTTSGSSQGVYQWNGSQWAQIGSALSHTPQSVGDYGGKIVAGTEGGGLYEWSGSQWMQLGSMNAWSNGFLDYNGSLLGAFSNQIVPQSTGVMEWTGTEWGALGTLSGNADQINSLSTMNMSHPGVYKGQDFTVLSDLNHSSVVAHWGGATYLIDYWIYLTGSGSVLEWSYSTNNGRTWTTDSKTLSTWWADSYNMQGAVWDPSVGAVVGYVGTTNSMGAETFIMTSPTSINLQPIGNDATNANGGSMALDSAGGGYLALEQGNSGSAYGGNGQTFHYVEYTSGKLTQANDSPVLGLTRPIAGEGSSIVSTGQHTFTALITLSNNSIIAADVKWDPTTNYVTITNSATMSESNANPIAARWISSLGVVKFYYTDSSNALNPVLYSNTYNPTTNKFGTPVAETQLTGYVAPGNIAFYLPNDITVIAVYSSGSDGAVMYRTDNITGAWSTIPVTTLPTTTSVVGVGSAFNGDTSMANFEYATYDGSVHAITNYQVPLGGSSPTTTAPQLPTVIAATSSPVTVQWYQWQLSLAANPTSLNEGSFTTLTATSSGAPSGSVIQIWNTTDNKMVGQSPVNAASLTATWTEQQAITDTFVAYFVDPSTGKQLQDSNSVQVTWKQIPLTLTNAIVTHTLGWLKNLQSYNAYYATRDPSLVRPLSYFWAGEEFVLRAEPSVSTIAQATVTFSWLNYSSFAPFGAPTQFTVNLTYNPATGLLEGNSNPSWSTWFQYLKDGTYTVTFWAKSTDNQVATAQASFTIDAPWVSGNDPKTYFHEHQTW